MMGWESSDVVRFGLGPLLQVQTSMVKLKGLITCLLLVLDVFNVKPTYGKSWAGNHLTLVPSFKVKQWITGFGELSFWWTQICICSAMRRSIYLCFNYAVTLFISYHHYIHVKYLISLTSQLLKLSNYTCSFSLFCRISCALIEKQMKVKVLF